MLYRIDRADTPTDPLEGIAETDAVVLEAQGGEQWIFHLRFTDHERLSAFHDHLIDRGIPIQVQRTYTLSEETELVRQFGLTEAQRKALALATGGTSTFREGRTSRDWPTYSAPPARRSPSGSVRQQEGVRCDSPFVGLRLRVSPHFSMNGVLVEEYSCIRWEVLTGIPRQRFDVVAYSVVRNAMSPSLVSAVAVTT